MCVVSETNVYRPEHRSGRLCHHRIFPRSRGLIPIIFLLSFFYRLLFLFFRLQRPSLEMIFLRFFSFLSSSIRLDNFFHIFRYFSGVLRLLKESRRCARPLHAMVFVKMSVTDFLSLPGNLFKLNISSWEFKLKEKSKTQKFSSDKEKVVFLDTNHPQRWGRQLLSL